MSITAVHAFVRATLEEAFPEAVVWCDWYQPERMPSHIADINVMPMRMLRDTLFPNNPLEPSSWKGGLECVAEVRGAARQPNSVNEYKLANNVACVLETTPFMPSKDTRIVKDAGGEDRFALFIDGIVDARGDQIPIYRPFPMQCMVTNIEFIKEGMDGGYMLPLALVHFVITPLNLTLDDIIINPRRATPTDYGAYEEVYIEHDGALPEPSPWNIYNRQNDGE